MGTHLPSTCHVMGAYGEQIVLLLNEPVVDPVYRAMYEPCPLVASTISMRMSQGQ